MNSLLNQQGDSWLEIISGFQIGYHSAIVILGTTLLGGAAGIIGTFSLLRKRTLMADALAHSALPGIAVAFLLSVSLGIDSRHQGLLLLGAAVSGLLGVLSVQALGQLTRLGEDTAIGAVLSSFFGFGIVLLSVIQSIDVGEAGGIHQFLFGQTASITFPEAQRILFVGVITTLLSFFLFKEFQLTAFDRPFAITTGWPVFWIDLILMTGVVLITIVGLQVVGLLLVVSLLVIPPCTGRLWSSRLSSMILISASTGAVSCFVGSLLSSELTDVPTGAVIVLSAGSLFGLSFLLAPERGLLATTFRSFSLRYRISTDHLLRECYELLESMGPVAVHSPLPQKSLYTLSSLSPLVRLIFIRLLKYRGLIRTSGSGAVLTEDGVKLAKQKVRNHRLWEIYLTTHTDLSPTHVDVSADLVEHFLSEELIHQLEELLLRQGKGRPPDGLPQSIHPIAQDRKESIV